MHMTFGIFLVVTLITFFAIGGFFFVCDLIKIRAMDQIKIFFILYLVIFLLDVRTYQNGFLGDRVLLVYFILAFISFLELVTYVMRVANIDRDAEAEHQDLKLLKLSCALMHLNFTMFKNSERVKIITLTEFGTTRIETLLFPLNYFENTRSIMDLIIKSKTYKAVYIGTSKNETILKYQHPSLIGELYSYVR